VYRSYIDNKLNAEVLSKNSARAIYSRLDPKYSSKDAPTIGWRILKEEQERRRKGRIVTG
jgi:hypothetical protein